MWYRHGWFLPSVMSLTLLGLSSRARGSVQDAANTLGFEDATLWTVENGAIQGTTTTRTQGAAALALGASGYAVLHSRVVGPLGEVAPTLSIDLMLPNVQPTPSWQGATQLFVSVPSLGLYNAYLGQVELTGLSPGVFHRLQFSVPPTILPILRGAYSDLSFSIALNVPAAAGAVYVVDNLEVTSTIPPNSTVGEAERLPILGFETEDGWQLSAGSIAGPSVMHATQGNFALGINPGGFSVLTSRPMPSIGPIDPTFTFDLWLPPNQVNPAWYGAVQLFVSIPSLGTYNAYLGQNELTPLPLGQFSTLSFAVPPELVSAFNDDYFDLQFSIVFNVPYGSSGTYYVDNMRIGALTTPPAVLPSDTPIRRDLVGLARSGMVYVSADDESATPAVTLGALYVEEQDHQCVPTSTRACRYIVHLARFHASGFSMFDTNFAGLGVFNIDPFEVVIGGNGPSSLSSPIPSNVLFAVVVEGQGKVFSAFPGARSSITINPSGAGMIAMSGQLNTTVDGHGVNFEFSVVADSPLANRPPIANAGQDQSVSSTNGCEVALTLDGSATTDPDGNLVDWRWYEGDALWGTGATLNANLHHSGTHIVTLRAVDRFGSATQDDVLITATLPSNCN